MDIINGPHYPARLPLLYNQTAVHPVPCINAGLPFGRGAAHFKAFRPPPADIVKHNGNIVRMDDFLFQKYVGIIVKLIPPNPHAGPRLIADEHILVHQVFKHHGVAGFHGNPVHLLLTFQLHLKRLALCNIHHGPLDDMVSLRRGPNHHVGPLQPMDRTVLPPGTVLHILPVTRLFQHGVAPTQQILVLGQHISQHTVMPVRKPLLHAVIPLQQDGCPVRGNQPVTSVPAMGQTDNAAGHGIINAAKQLRLFPQTLGIVL